MSSDPTAPTASEAVPSRAPDLVSCVGGTASSLQEDLLGRRGDRRQTAARARLAVLRRGAGRAPENDPIAWQTVLDSLTPPLPGRMQGHGDSASPSERAAFDAMTLFALHMQSATRPMHERGRSFGTAVGRLARDSGSNSLKPRFDALLAARDERSRLTHARSLITLLRGEDIGFDYGRFALDLRSLSGKGRQGVLLRWGRDFVTGHRRERSTEPEAHGPGTSSTDF